MHTNDPIPPQMLGLEICAGNLDVKLLLEPRGHNTHDFQKSYFEMWACQTQGSFSTWLILDNLGPTEVDSVSECS